MIEPFSWAANKDKLERARVASGQDASEEKIKEVYESLGGLVVEGYEVPEVKEAKKARKRK